MWFTSPTFYFVLAAGANLLFFLACFFLITKSLAKTDLLSHLKAKLDPHDTKNPSLSGECVFKSYVDGHHELIIKLGKFNVEPNLLTVFIGQSELLNTQLVQSEIFYRDVDLSKAVQGTFERGAQISVCLNKEEVLSGELR